MNKGDLVVVAKLNCHFCGFYETYCLQNEPTRTHQVLRTHTLYELRMKSGKQLLLSKCELDDVGVRTNEAKTRIKSIEINCLAYSFLYLMKQATCSCSLSWNWNVSKKLRIILKKWCRHCLSERKCLATVQIQFQFAWNPRGSN